MDQGKKLKAFLDERNLLQQDLADLIGMSRSRVNDHLNRPILSPKFLDKVCKALKVKKEDITGITNNHESQIAYNIKGSNNQQYNMGIAECVGKLELAQQKIQMLQDLIKEKDERIADLKGMRK